MAIIYDTIKILQLPSDTSKVRIRLSDGHCQKFLLEYDSLKIFPES